MKTIENYEAEKLTVEFQEVSYGLIYFALTLGDKSFETRFSEVFDPLADFRKWLEAISIGVNQCSFWFDTEGNEIKFDLDRLSWNREIFTVTEPYEDAEIFLSDKVNRKQLVEEFYVGFLNFFNSPKFDKHKWEVEYLWERLTENLKFSYSTIVTEFSKLDRNKLKDLLFKVDPQYIISCKDAPEMEAFGYLIDNYLGEETPPEYEIVKTPIERKIPKGYDKWSMRRKRKFVEKCLQMKTFNSLGGTKISDFKSQIIENYLKSEKPKKRKLLGFDLID